MFHLQDYAIEPGVGIGTLRLGMTFNEIKSVVSDFEVEDLPKYALIVCDNVKIWIHKKRILLRKFLYMGIFAASMPERLE